MARRTFPSRLGYDPGTLELLSARDRTSIEAISLLVPMVVGLTGASGAYAVAAVAGSWTVGLGAGAFLAWVVWTIHRLAVGGAGVALHEHQGAVSSYKPSLWPGLVIALFGLASAQPLLAWALRESIQPGLEAMRSRLLDEHAREALGPIDAALAEQREELERLDKAEVGARARREELVAALGRDSAGPRVKAERDVIEAELKAIREDRDRIGATLEALAQKRAEHEASLPGFAERLGEQEFLVYRIQLVWKQRRGTALAVSLALAVRFMLFFILRRLLGAPIVRYEAFAQARGRKLVRAHDRQGWLEAARSLAVYPTWRPRREFLDPPFDSARAPGVDDVPVVTPREALRRLRGA